MTGRAEVERLKQQLDATFQRAVATKLDAEPLSDLARYLCVLVSGFLEQAVIELLLEHIRGRSSASVQQYAERQLRRVTNLKAQRLIDLFGSFDPNWQSDLEQYLVDENKDAVNTVVDLRNTIAHGRSAPVTMSRVRKYSEAVNRVVDHLADLCLPR
jgi:hypothetical protein